jgi:hypothetical protein
MIISVHNESWEENKVLIVKGELYFENESFETEIVIVTLFSEPHRVLGDYTGVYTFLAESLSLRKMERFK